jgi:hypothetical protein
MPVYLEPEDVTAELEGFNSVLIVSCPVCPPMSLAMREKKPFLELFKHGLDTGAFQDYVKSIREPLEQRGIRTGVHSRRAPAPTMCLWTQGQRRRLAKRAEDYEAVLVLGCDSAAYTARDALKDTDCQVLQGMRTTAIANATMTFRFPLTVELDMHPLPATGGEHRREARPGAAAEIEKVSP